MGEAHDLGARIAETTVHTVAVRAVCPGDGDLAIPDGDNIGAGVIGDGEFLVDGQINGAEKLTMGANFRQGRRGTALHEKQAQTHTYDNQTKKKDDPIF